MKKVLFIDRDGTLVEEPGDEILNSFEKLEFLPGVLKWLGKISTLGEYELVMVTNQDGLGTEALPNEEFYPVHNFIIKIMEGEGIQFVKVHIDDTFPEDKKDTRKPGIGMLGEYLSSEYDMGSSWVIGDRYTDIELAKNLGCGGILINNMRNLGAGETKTTENELDSYASLKTKNWKEVYDFLILESRRAAAERKTHETDISAEIDLDGRIGSEITTGLNFFDHMLQQIPKHSGIGLNISCKGDLEVDEHHTIEDTAIVLGELFHKALGSKRGIERYGFVLPMDDCLAEVAIDFGGRSWLVWDAEFNREKVGDVPTEMFYHFFKSFTDSAKCNLNIKASGTNEHHKIESIFKGFAKAIKRAIKRDSENLSLPSTKGRLE